MRLWLFPGVCLVAVLGVVAGYQTGRNMGQIECHLADIKSMLNIGKE